MAEHVPQQPSTWRAKPWQPGTEDAAEETGPREVWPSVRKFLGISELFTECISAGESHSLAVVSDSSAIALGNPRHSHCIIPALQGRLVKQASAGGRHSIIVFEDGTAKAFGDNRHSQCNIPWLELRGKKIMQASAGGNHSILVMEDGSALAFGDNGDGQCRTPALYGRKVVQASAGKCHSILVLEDGTAKAFGNQFYGRCWIPDLSNKAIAHSSAGADHSILVLEDGTVKAFGNNRHGQCAVPELGGKKVVQAAAGGKHSILVLSDGTAQAFGDNSDGQCDIPDLQDKKIIYAAAGERHSVLMLEDGSAKAFGNNTDGQCGFSELMRCKKGMAASAIMLVRSLCADNANTRRATAAALAQMTEESQTVAGFILSRLVALKWERRQAATRVCIEHSTILMQATDEDGNSPLHLAASEGDLETCRILVSSGALIVARNSSRQTALDVARSKGNSKVADFLESKQTIGGARGGSGNAWPAAAKDERPIQGMDWFVLPLEGWSGRMGIVHSLLRLVVAGEGGENMYALEKAALPQDLPEQDVQRLCNGVYVSYWKDVAPNIASVSIRSLKPGDISTSPQTIGSLRSLLIEMGTYDVSLRNCHHAALMAYNACALHKLDESEMPNTNFLAAAGLLRRLGFEGSVVSASTASGAASVSSTAGATGGAGGFAGSMISTVESGGLYPATDGPEHDDRVPPDRHLPESTGDIDYLYEITDAGVGKVEHDIVEDHGDYYEPASHHGGDGLEACVRTALRNLRSAAERVDVSFRGPAESKSEEYEGLVEEIGLFNEELARIEVHVQQLQHTQDWEGVLWLIDAASNSLRLESLLPSENVAKRVELTRRNLHDGVAEILQGRSLHKAGEAVPQDIQPAEFVSHAAEDISLELAEEAQAKKSPSCCVVA